MLIVVMVDERESTSQVGSVSGHATGPRAQEAPALPTAMAASGSQSTWRDVQAVLGVGYWRWRWDWRWLW
jgi:hypothetical protein